MSIHLRIFIITPVLWMTRSLFSLHTIRLLLLLLLTRTNFCIYLTLLSKDRPQVYRRKGSPQATCHQGCPQIRSNCWRSEEAPPLPSRNRRSSRNPKVPKVYRSLDPQGPLPTSRSRSCSGFQVRPSFPIHRRLGFARSGRSVLGWTLRGHQLVCHSRQACYYHAKRYSIGSSYPWRTCLSMADIRSGEWKE